MSIGELGMNFGCHPNFIPNDPKWGVNAGRKRRQNLGYVGISSHELWMRRKWEEGMDTNPFADAQRKASLDAWHVGGRSIKPSVIKLKLDAQQLRGTRANKAKLSAHPSRTSPIITPDPERQPVRNPCEPRARSRALPIRRACSTPHLRPPRHRVIPQTEPRSAPESAPLHSVSTKRNRIERMNVEAPRRRRVQKVAPAKAVTLLRCQPRTERVFDGSQGRWPQESLCLPPKMVWPAPGF